MKLLRVTLCSTAALGIGGVAAALAELDAGRPPSSLPRLRRSTSSTRSWWRSRCRSAAPGASGELPDTSIRTCCARSRKPMSVHPSFSVPRQEHRTDDYRDGVDEGRRICEGNRVPTVPCPRSLRARRPRSQ